MTSSNEDDCVEPTTERIAANGTWLYAGMVPTHVQIVQREIAYGSGDYEDPPEIREDQQGPCFVILWGSPGEGDVFRSASGNHATLEDAIREASRLAPGIAWTNATR